MTRKIDTRYPIELTLLPETTETEILQNIYCILTTVKGSVPHLRDYGLDSSYLHQPIPIAKASYAAAVADAIDLYEPRVKVQSVTFETDADAPEHLYPVLEVIYDETRI